MNSKKLDYIEIENNISKSLKKFKELNNAEPLDEIVINNKNLDNNNKSINNDFVYNKYDDLLKEIENQTNSEEINDIHFKNILFNIVEENIKELDTKTESSEKNSSDVFAISISLLFSKFCFSALLDFFY